jgi:2,4-dienoyl-CoA reductase-like NADH-dependent reductase (Old Yellow Enzyme family)
MCQYSSIDGFASDWHLVHLGSRAVGGAGLVMMEATAVESRGRISPGDHGIWKDEHIAMLARIAAFVKERGAVPGIQIAHAGRKASCHVPWEHNGAPIPMDAGGWETVAPSAIPFREGDPVPRALDHNGIRGIVDAFAQSARRALAAGFEVLELHCAHGYLAHEFLSPLANKRTDEYGGSFQNRIRFVLDLAEAVRRVLARSIPAIRANFRYRLERRRLDLGRFRESRAGIAWPRRGFDRLLVGRNGARCQDPHRSRLSSAVCRAHQAGSWNSNRSGRYDHGAAPGG